MVHCIWYQTQDNSLQIFSFNCDKQFCKITLSAFDIYVMKHASLKLVVAIPWIDSLGNSWAVSESIGLGILVHWMWELYYTEKNRIWGLFFPGQILSMGYGFVTFRKASKADKALKTLQRSSLDEHELELKISNRAERSSMAVYKPLFFTPSPPNTHLHHPKKLYCVFC